MYENVSFELEKKGFKFQEIMKLHLGEISNLKEKNEKLLKN